MNDLISRQDAIDAIDVLCQEHRYRIPGKAETYSQYNEAWQGALNRAEGAIFNLPSAQQKQRWILCSERLPEVGEDVLATVKIPKMGLNLVFIAFRCRTASDGVFNWSRDDYRMVFENDEVVAWMPLPDVYKEDD